jgi:hypothetical protein
MLKKDDLKEPNEMIHRFLMSFSRVPTQSDKREESNGLIPSSQQQKNSKKRKKATKYEQQSAYFLEGRVSKVNRKKH